VRFSKKEGDLLVFKRPESVITIRCSSGRVFENVERMYLAKKEGSII